MLSISKQIIIKKKSNKIIFKCYLKVSSATVKIVKYYYNVKQLFFM